MENKFVAIVSVWALSFLVIKAELNFTIFRENCLNGSSIQDYDESCESQKNLKAFISRQGNDQFFCITYEKTNGSKHGFDIVEFSTEGKIVDFSYKGALLISSDLKNSDFKVYKNSEKTMKNKDAYKARFAISSDDLKFKINGIAINGINQICTNLQTNTTILPTSPEATTNRQPSSTTRKHLLQSTTTSPSTFSNCGVIQKSIDLKKIGLPSNLGDFPWIVSIFKFTEYGEIITYKCSGTIIDNRRILTSLNCLLEDGEILEANEIKIHAARYSLFDRNVNFMEYDVLGIQFQDYSVRLDNNIAIVTLATNIIFNDFIQPACLPGNDASIYGKIGKLAGFGKPSAALPPKSDVLTEAEYSLDLGDQSCVGQNCKTFYGLNTSGNVRISDLGSGLFMNIRNKWTIVGIVSKSLHFTKQYHDNKVLFVNVAHYREWILSKDEPIIDV